MSSSRAGPVPSRIGVRSMITGTYLSPFLVWRHTCPQPAHHAVPRRTLTPTPATPTVLIDDPARQDRTAGLQTLPGDLQTELIEAAERGQARASEGSVRLVEVFQMGGVRTSILGRPRPLPSDRRADHRYTLNVMSPQSPLPERDARGNRLPATSPSSASAHLVSNQPKNWTRSAQSSPRYALRTSSLASSSVPVPDRTILPTSRT